MNDDLLDSVSEWLRNERPLHVERALTFSTLRDALEEYHTRQREIIESRNRLLETFETLGGVLVDPDEKPREKLRAELLRRVIRTRVTQLEGFLDELSKTIVAIRKAFRNQNRV